MIAVSTRPGTADDQIALLDVETGAFEIIIPNGSAPQYSPTGHIVYGLDGTLRAVSFDLDSRKVTSDPIPVVEGVVVKSRGRSESPWQVTAPLFPFCPEYFGQPPVSDAGGRVGRRRPFHPAPAFRLHGDSPAAPSSGGRRP